MYDAITMYTQKDSIRGLMPICLFKASHPATPTCIPPAPRFLFKSIICLNASTYISYAMVCIRCQ